MNRIRPGSSASTMRSNTSESNSSYLNVRRGVPSLLRLHDPHSLRAAFVRHWSRANGIELKNVHKAVRVISCWDQRAELTLERDVHSLISCLVPEPSLKDLELLLEHLHPAEKARSEGIVYTPTFIVDYLLDTALIFSRPLHGRPPIVCDPCCGAGAFLTRAAAILASSPKEIPRVLEEQVVGFDRDPLAIDDTKLLLELLALSQGHDLNSNRFPIQVGD